MINDYDFSNIICINLEREASQKNDNNKIKPNFGPLSYPSNIHTRPNLWQISRGEGMSGPPVPSLNLRMSIILKNVLINYAFLEIRYTQMQLPVPARVII